MKFQSLHMVPVPDRYARHCPTPACPESVSSLTVAGFLGQYAEERPRWKTKVELSLCRAVKFSISIRQ